jgi:hypothetical protein
MCVALKRWVIWLCPDVLGGAARGRDGREPDFRCRVREGLLRPPGQSGRLENGGNRKSKHLLQVAFTHPELA